MNTTCCLCGEKEVMFSGNVGKHNGSVLSDSTPIDHGSSIYRCQKCFHWQKVQTKEEWNIIGNNYAHYKGHQLSKGVEQLVFPPGLPPRPRSYHALEQCKTNLPSKGRMLDFGCGDGAVLKSASKLLKDWELDAYDISEHCRDDVLKIPSVKNFYSKSASLIPEGKYDLVVLWHTLEHVPQPSNELNGLLKYVNTNGMLLIQVPDVARNPFDLGVFDHVSHFTREALIDCARRGGWTLIADGWDWTHNCLTVLLRPGNIDEETRKHGVDNDILRELNRRFERYAEATACEDYVIWGTGMASLLILGQLSRKPKYFIDEDESRSGGNVRGIKIIHPREATNIVTVLLPFPENTAERIKNRAVKDYVAFKKANWVAE